jgi:hypothetical protein
VADLKGETAIIPALINLIIYLVVVGLIAGLVFLCRRRRSDLAAVQPADQGCPRHHLGCAGQRVRSSAMMHPGTWA